jgi:hypothetical protein
MGSAFIELFLSSKKALGSQKPGRQEAPPNSFVRRRLQGPQPKFHLQYADIMEYNSETKNARDRVGLWSEEVDGDYGLEDFIYL